MKLMLTHQRKKSIKIRIIVHIHRHFAYNTKPASQSEKPLPASGPTAKKSLNKGTMIALGVGAVAAIGGGAAILTSDSDNGDEGDANEPFTGTFEAEYISDVMFSTTTMNLIQEGENISGMRISTCGISECCEASFTVSVEGTADGNSARNRVYEG